MKMKNFKKNLIYCLMSIDIFDEYRMEVHYYFCEKSLIYIYIFSIPIYIIYLLLLHVICCISFT